MTSLKTDIRPILDLGFHKNALFITKDRIIITDQIGIVTV